MRAGLMMGARTSDIVLPSFDEEQVLFGDEDPAQSLERYRAQGADLVAVKQGPGDLLLWQRDSGARVIPATQVETVVDTTAAGDSFAAGLLAGLARGKTLEDSARGAMALAGQVIQGRGALVAEAVSKAGHEPA